MLQETLRFVRRHWPHLLLAVPGAIAVTIVHESAHAIAVLLQGGRLTRFVWLPSAGRWGFVSYEFPIGVPYSRLAILLAPYGLWLLLALGTAAAAFYGSVTSFRKASLLYFWLFFVPLADIANTAFPYLAGTTNDFRFIFGEPSVLLVGGLIGLATALAVVAGYIVQRRLYLEDSLSAPSYFALSGIVLVLLVALTV